MSTLSILLAVLFAGFAVSYGWGIRGFIIGGEKGALLPGALMGIAVSFFAMGEQGRELWMFFAAAGALTMFYGGTETYAQTMSFLLSRDKEGPYYNRLKKGVTGIFLKGALWFAIPGFVLALLPCALAGAYKIWEIAVPMGVIAAIVPSTNPTSTICYKAIIALKAGNSIIFSPHPKAIGCSLQAAKVVMEAAKAAGAPDGCVNCLSMAAMAGTQELMSAPEVKLILATGGPAMVRSAYSSGKPAIGVGAGNGPAYIHHSSDLHQALRHILRSKTFDYGTVCASEQSIIVEKQMEENVINEASKMGYYFMSHEEADRLAKMLFRPNGALDPDVVGKPASHLANMAGFSIPSNTKILVAREQQAGPAYPYSMEKLCPVLAFYVMDNEQKVLEKVIEVLSHEGSGHTFVMHCEDRSVIEQFALNVPVSRFLVNTPAALGGIGYSTSLFPALTLGCGAVGGSSSSNNISPMDLINIRKVAWNQSKEDEHTPVDQNLVNLLTAKILERLK